MINLEVAKEWYKTADSVHDFDHILRVYRLAEVIGEKEGANLEIVRAAVLLHDAEGLVPGNLEKRAEHHERSAEFAKAILEKEKWGKEKILAVLHCILAHRFRSTEYPRTIEAKVVFDADKLDAIGAVGAARAIAYAALDQKPFYSKPSAKFLKSFQLEENELHSSFHEFLFKLRNIKDRLFTQTAKEIASNRHQYLEGFFEQLGSEYVGER